MFTAEATWVPGGVIELSSSFFTHATKFARNMLVKKLMKKKKRVLYLSKTKQWF